MSTTSKVGICEIEGALEGYWDGILDIVGANEGVKVGTELGTFDGNIVGRLDGTELGANDGACEGAADGIMLIDGDELGASARVEKTVVELEERRKLTSLTGESLPARLTINPVVTAMIVTRVAAPPSRRSARLVSIVRSKSALSVPGLQIMK